jgi:peptidoglycan/LPS O-acetylase OafA/YrhL
MSRAGRVTPTAAPLPERRLGHRPALDGLRGVAILLVVSWHTLRGGLTGAGQAGVTLFFVLSGFLITTLLIEERDRFGRIDLRRFYLRRAARLLPALFLMMGAAAVVIFVAHPPDGAVALLTPLFYVANWAQAAHLDLWPVQHTWTLAIEEQFYLVWPLLLSTLLLIRPRWTLYAIVLGFVVSTALRFYFAPWNEDQALWGTDTRADALLAGCAVAFLASWRPIHVPTPVAVVAAIAFGVVVVTGSPAVLLAGGLTVIALTSAVVVTSTVESPSRVLSWAPLRWFGTISYSLYLWNSLVFNAFPGLPHLVLVVPAILIAAASTYWLEQPITRRVRRATTMQVPAARLARSARVSEPG